MTIVILNVEKPNPSDVPGLLSLAVSAYSSSQAEGGCHCLVISFKSHSLYGDFGVLDLKISYCFSLEDNGKNEKIFLYYMKRECCLQETLKTQRLLMFPSLF